MNVEFPRTELKRIVIVGGGFAGIELVKKLDSNKFLIVLLDRNNYHTFQPLLYQVATGELEPDSIAYPIRKIFRHKSNFHFRVATAKRIISEKNVLITDIGEISYDYLVIASGSTTNYFENDEFQKHTIPLKTLTEALDMRSFIFQNCEAALLSKDKEEQKRLLNVLIIGGGPTGVEIAGAVTELKKHALPGDYPELDFSLMQIQVIESLDALLKTMSTNAQQNAKSSLEKMGVKVHLNTILKNYDGLNAELSSGQTIQSKAMIWTAGVKGMTIDGINEAIVKGNRLLVDLFSCVKGYKNIFALGDVAVMIHDIEPQGHPMLAAVAVQQGRNLAKNMNDENRFGRFYYNDKGSMATIGRNRAVADLKFIKLQGFIAWMAWLFIHLIMLVGFRNRIIVLINWMWNYFSYDRAIRLIVRPFKRAKVSNRKKSI